MPFDRACALLDSALAGGARRALLDAIEARSAGGLRRLSDALKRNLRAAGDQYRALADCVHEMDARTRVDAFHVLNDWDGKADRFSPQTIATDVAEFTIRQDVGGDVVAALLLDYYYLNLLALLSLRAWDAGEPDRNLDRLDGLLARLQGIDGSGHRFARRASTLILIATAHFEPDERGYGSLLEKVRSLGRRQRLAVALDHAVAIGCHLRFGFETTYGRDVGAMRDDNLADYPWLSFALSTLMEAYTPGDWAIAEALVNGLCPDPGAFVGRAPAALARVEPEQTEFRERFHMHRAGLVDAFERCCPGTDAYSPLGFFFNFSHNVVKGAIVDAALSGTPWDVGLNDLFEADRPPEGASDTPAASGISRKIERAAVLMDYARHNPNRIRGRLTPVIVYDPRTGRRAFGHAMRVLKEVT